MFSDHMRKIKPARGRGFFLAIAGTLLIAVQLFGMAQVAGNQVRKAQLRDVQLQLQRVAMENCMETRPRVDRDSCLRLGPQDPTGSDQGSVSLTALTR